MTHPHPSTRTILCIAACAGLLAFGGTAAAADAKKPAKPVAAKHAPAKAPVEVAVPEAAPEQIDAAERVYYGAYECEFNQTVDIEKSPKHPAYVNVKHAKSAWLMKPVLSSTGAVRLEDVKGETLMVQIASKSMLLNVKTAHRLVDDCISPKQRELIAAAKAAKEAEMAGTAASAAGSPLLAGPGSTTEATASRK